MKNLFNDMGSHKTDKGYSFKTYAPGAKEVRLKLANADYAMESNKGYWELEVEGAKPGEIYGFIIDGVEKADPFAQKVIAITKNEVTSVLYDSEYVFKKEKVQQDVVNVFEVYLTDIRGRNFQEKAFQVVHEAKGYSHIQVMPFVQAPDITLGYKTSSYFAPNHKFGELDDFKEFVDILHANGFGVILDFVIFEFEEFSKQGLHNYDGEYLFNLTKEGLPYKNDVFTGWHFDTTKPFVQDFLHTVMMYYVNELNADGIRIDGVNELIFKDRIKQEIHKGNISFLKAILKKLPEDVLVFADLLTHQTVDSLGLTRINYVEGSAPMFKLQKYIKMGNKKLEKVQAKELKELRKTLAWVTTHPTLGCLNHDIHIDGYVHYVPNGHMKDAKDFEFLKMLLFAIPGPKQIYQGATINEKYSQLIIALKDAEFSYEVTDDFEVIFKYAKEDTTHVFNFDVKERALNMSETKNFKLI